MKYFAVIIVFLIGSGLQSFAEDAPKTWTVDMTAALLDQDGKPVEDQFTKPAEDKDCSRCQPLTLGNAAAHALFFVSGDEREVTPEQKWSWAVLAEQIRSDPKAALTAAQADLIYRRLGKMYGGLILLRAMPLIDPNRKPPEIK